MIAAAMGGKPFRWPAGTYVHLSLIHILEYNEAKQNLMKSQSDELQAKYDYLFRTTILDFYKG